MGKRTSMFPLIDCSPQKLFTLASEAGFADKFGQLLTPLTGYKLHPEASFAVDNGGFSRAVPKQWCKLLARVSAHKDRCLWVSIPDVPGDARRTLELFDFFEPTPRAYGFRIALVAQDGIENMQIPWNRIHAVFIGGTTEWKMSQSAANVIRTAQWMGKPVHVGRINTAGRWEMFAKMGADTFDGSGLARPFPGARQNRAAIAESRASILDESPALLAGYTGSDEISVPTVDRE